MTNIRQFKWRPLLAVATLMMMVLISASCARGEPQRIDPESFNSPESLTLSDMSFFMDSMYLVHLGPEENAEQPIRVGVYYQGSGVSLTPSEVRGAIEGAVEDRPGARWELIAGNVDVRGVTPSIAIVYDLYAQGGVRGDMIHSCPVYGSDSGRPIASRDEVRTMRALFTQPAFLKASVAGLLADAAKLRCPSGPPGRSVLPVRALR